MALSPMVVIGCGGSGGKVVLGLRKRLDEELRRRGWQEGIPSAWQFKWIDVPNQQESHSEFGPSLPAPDYLGLARDWTYYAPVDAALRTKAQTQLERLAGWRVNPHFELPVNRGAGQKRAVGRSVALTRADEIASFVRGSVNSIPAGVAKLERLGDFLRGDPERGVEMENVPLIVVVSSLAGGSGAGIFMDVCDLVRSVNPSYRTNVFAFLFTAEIFKEVQEGAGGMPSNTVAALTELMSGKLSSSRPLEPLYPGAGAEANGGGPFAPYIIGLQPLGDGAPLTSSADCYRAVTETLLATMIDERFKNDFLQYDTTNFNNFNTTHDRDVPHKMLKESVDGSVRCGIVSSFGSAKVSVGSAWFADWARDRLAHDVVEHVRSGWRKTGVQLLGRANVSDPEVIEFLVNQDREVFFDRCGLWEEDSPDGTKHDQVVEAILSTDDLRLQAQRWRDSMIGELGSLGKLNLAAWVDQITKVARLRESSFLDTVGESIDRGAQTFVEELPNRVSSAVADVLARFGQPVTARLVDTLKEQCKSAVDQLRHQAMDSHDSASIDPTAAVTAQLRSIGDGKVSSGSNFVAEAIRMASGPAAHMAFARRYTRASDLLEQVVQKVLTPLGDTLQATGAKLAEFEEFEKWPSDAGVSDLYAPPPSEFCLVTKTEWATVLDQLVRTQAGSMSKARDAIAAGGFRHGPPGNDQVAPIAVNLEGDSWWGKYGLPVQVTIAFDPEEVQERARAWVENVSQPLGKFVASGLAEYLATADDAGKPIADHTQRLTAFEEALARAHAMARPLFRVPSEAMQLVHPGAKLNENPGVQEFPFGPGHPARGAVTEVLGGGAKFTAATRAGVESILLTSRLQAPVHPAAIASLYEPIVARWKAVTDRSDRHTAIRDFWTYNRARLLTEFIPLAQPAIDSIIRGWFVGRLLGLVPDPQPNQPIVVRWHDHRTPPVPRNSQFPSPLLREGYQSHLELANAEWLPALLEHLGLADDAVGQPAAHPRRLRDAVRNRAGSRRPPQRLGRNRQGSHRWMCAHADGR